MARVAGAVVTIWRSRGLADAASRTLRSTAGLPPSHSLWAGWPLAAAQRNPHVGAGVRRHDDLLGGGDPPGQQRRVHRHSPLDQGEPDRAELVVPGRGPGETDRGAVELDRV